jgi:hypothetical protein
MESSIVEINVKEVVKEKYGQAALRAQVGSKSSCCGAVATDPSCACDPIEMLRSCIS